MKRPVSEFFEGETGESALSAVLRTDEQRRLYTALDTLDEKRRVAVVLYYFDDRSVKEIAQATGVTEGTVKSRPVFRPPPSAAGADRTGKQTKGGRIT